jgi:hypothetical protein
MTEQHPPSRVLRQQFEHEYALPLARAIFELEPRCQSVLVTVGQYWCDEATDAVHSELIACTEREPIWPLAAQARPGALGDTDALAAMLELEAKYAETDDPPGLGEVQYGLLEEACQRAFGEQYYSVLDDNSDMIVAFASYCREVSDQEQPSWRSHTPYGLVRRPLQQEPATLEVIGRMYRPHWEDRWDVLDKDGIISGWNDGPAEPPASGAPAALSEPSASGAKPAELGPPFVKRPPAETAGGLKPAYRVLLFALLILAIIVARACRK